MGPAQRTRLARVAGPGLRRCSVRCLTGAVHRASAAVPHPPSLDALTRQDVSGGRLSSRRPAGTDSPPTELPRANTQQSITRLHQYHGPLPAPPGRAPHRPGRPPLSGRVELVAALHLLSG
jgi:hypothetical protein